MNQRWITVSILIVVFLITAFLLPPLQSPLLGLNGLTIALILVLLFGDTKLALIAGIAGGCCMDLISPFPFGTFIAAYTLTLIITRQINHIWVTNRSLSAYASLTIIGMALFHLCVYGYGYFGSLFDSSAISPPMGRAVLMSGATDVLRGFIIAMCIYVIVRLTGHSYATLTRHEF